MRLVGRKLYMSWGDNTVVAIEKLAISPEEIGLKKASEISAGKSSHGEFMKLVDVIDVFGERIEQNPRVPLSPSPIGMEFQEYFQKNGNWIGKNDIPADDKSGG